MTSIRLASAGRSSAAICEPSRAGASASVIGSSTLVARRRYARGRGRAADRGGGGRAPARDPAAPRCATRPAPSAPPPRATQARPPSTGTCSDGGIAEVFVAGDWQGMAGVDPDARAARAVGHVGRAARPRARRSAARSPRPRSAGRRAPRPRAADADESSDAAPAAERLYEAPRLRAARAHRATARVRRRAATQHELALDLHPEPIRIETAAACGVRARRAAAIHACARARTSPLATPDARDRERPAQLRAATTIRDATRDRRDDGASGTPAIDHANGGRWSATTPRFFLTSAEHRQGEIGFLVHPDHQGHGYATEAAARPARARLRHVRPAPRSSAAPRRATSPSARVLEKARHAPGGAPGRERARQGRVAERAGLRVLTASRARRK